MATLVMIVIMILLSALAFVWVSVSFSYMMAKDLKMEDRYEKETHL